MLIVCITNFQITPTLFKQVYTIHALIKAPSGDILTLPALYCLLSGSDQALYQEVFDAIRYRRPALVIESAMTDFEKAAQNAIQETWPNADLIACLFHLGQSIYRHVKDLKFQKLYEEDEDVRRRCKFLMGLAFVPPNFVVQAFEVINNQLTGDIIEKAPRLADLYDYFEKTYIGGIKRGVYKSGRFPIDIWNVYERTVNGLPRTDNSSEGLFFALIIFSLFMYT